MSGAIHKDSPEHKAHLASVKRDAEVAKAKSEPEKKTNEQSKPDDKAVGK